jgi:serpin B
MPKFEFDTKYFMKDTLSAMGMPTAFEWPGADFSGMDGSKNLYISSVIHQAYVKVDEKGTEAAAATAIIVGYGSVAPRSVFRADHPFIFIIQERETGNILFLGRVVDPRVR